MVQRGLEHREAEPGMAQRGGERPRERDRVGVDRDAVEMMFGQPHHVGAQLVRQHRLAHGLVNHRAIARRIAAVGKQERAEQHCRSIRHMFGSTIKP